LAEGKWLRGNGWGENGWGENGWGENGWGENGEGKLSGTPDLGPLFWGVIWNLHLGGDMGPWFDTLILDPDFGPLFGGWYGTSIWDPDLEGWYGTLIWWVCLFVCLFVCLHASRRDRVADFIYNTHPEYNTHYTFYSVMVCYNFQPTTCSLHVSKPKRLKGLL
jgi:hypothetical protein